MSDAKELHPTFRVTYEINSSYEPSKAALESIQTNSSDATTHEPYISTIVVTQLDVASSTEGRVRKSPAWMRDYVSGDNLTKEH